MNTAQSLTRPSRHQVFVAVFLALLAISAVILIVAVPWENGSGLLALILLVFLICRYTPLGIWLLSIGIMFPVVLLDYGGVRIKFLDICVVILLIVSLLGLGADGARREKLREAAHLPRSTWLGLLLFFAACLVSWLVSINVMTSTVFIVEAIEAYVLPVVIVIVLYSTPKMIYHFVGSLIASGVVAAVHAYLSALMPDFLPDLYSEYYHAAAGSYEGLNRVRGFHSFSLGYVLAIAAIFCIALIVGQLRRPPSLKGGLLVFLLIGSWGVLNFVILATFTRIWLVGEALGIVVVLLLGKLSIKSIARIGLAIAGIVLLAVLMLEIDDAAVSYVRAGFGRLGESAVQVNLRTEKWQLAWQFYGPNALVGVGGGNAKLPDASWYASTGDVDNGYLQVLLENGVAGLAGMLLMLFGVMAKLWTFHPPVGETHSFYGIRAPLLGGLMVSAVSLSSWNIWSQGSSAAILTGVLIALGAVAIAQQRRPNPSSHAHAGI